MISAFIFFSVKKFEVDVLLSIKANINSLSLNAGGSCDINFSLVMKINLIRFATAILFLLSIFSAGILAQNKDADSFDKGTNEFGVWIGGSPNDPTSFGSATGRKENCTVTEARVRELLCQYTIWEYSISLFSFLSASDGS